MIDKKKLEMNSFVLLVFSTLAFVCGTTASVRAQGVDDKTEVWVSKTSSKSNDMVVVSQRTSDTQTGSTYGSHDGMQAMFGFLRKNIGYSPRAIEAKIQGEVTFGFTVTKKGTVTNSRIIKKLYPALDLEVLEAVRKMPVSEFVKKDGQKVDTDYKVTMKFALPDGVSQTEPAVSVVEVETGNLKMTLTKRENKEGGNSATIATYDSAMKVDTVVITTVSTTSDGK